jgi:2-polyprenyl-3-methyl-5-hydroxy-6-metoxy-1,4-benzoquinol methylase
MSATLAKCVACGRGDTLATALDLGVQPLANNFHKPGAPDPHYPLALRQCVRCTHAQLSFSVDPRVLFSHYLYVSGTSETGLEHFRSFAQRVTDEGGGGGAGSARGSVLDIASNDGAQLDYFKALGWRTYGVDPASNLCTQAAAKGHAITCAFWDASVAASLPKFDVIVAQNVLAHTPDPHAFLSALALVCHAGTRVFVQTSQLRMFEDGQFDTMYHEHISFFTPDSMRILAARAGLALDSHYTLPIHGVSAVFCLRPDATLGVGAAPRSPNKVPSPDERTLFAIKARETIERFRAAAAAAAAGGFAVVGYGAAAKAMTVLNASGVRLEYIVDENPLKQGLLAPGTEAEVVPRHRLASDARPVFVVILAWNFRDEILRKIAEDRVGFAPVATKVMPGYFSEA